MVECARFCLGCPLTPPGVDVEISKIRFETANEAALFADDGKPSVATLHSVAIDVDRGIEPEVEVGDESRIMVETNGRNASEIYRDVRDCSGPHRRFRIGKKVCGALTIS